MRKTHIQVRGSLSSTVESSDSNVLVSSVTGSEGSVQVPQAGEGGAGLGRNGDGDGVGGVGDELVNGSVGIESLTSEVTVGGTADLDGTGGAGESGSDVSDELSRRPNGRRAGSTYFPARTGAWAARLP